MSDEVSSFPKQRCLDKIDIQQQIRDEYRRASLEADTFALFVAMGISVDNPATWLLAIPFLGFVCLSARAIWKSANLSRQLSTPDVGSRN